MKHKTKPEELKVGMLVLHTINLRIAIIKEIDIIGSKFSIPAIHVEMVYEDHYLHQFNEGKTGVFDIWYENVVEFTPFTAIKVAQYYRDVAGGGLDTLFQIEKIVKEKIYGK